MNDDVPSSIWALHAHGEQVECRLRSASDEVHVAILSDRSPIVSTTFPNRADALAWAEAERRAWLARNETSWLGLVNAGGGA
jgi:hypothetical protein